MPASLRPLLAVLAALSALALVTLLRLAPPAPRDGWAPPAEFSAARAGETVRALAGDGAPRPAGSPANVRTVDEIAARFRALGLETRVQVTFACGIYGTCATVRNVTARLGPEGPAAVVLLAHHDSVGAGPGVSDDLSGVAIVLEAARALAAGPPLARPLVALVTDAEETGLVGASAFAGEHPWASRVGAVVNLEARGTSGPSILFDTSGDPSWIARVARRMPHPVTTSLASTVYDLLPNDTDLTVLEQRGMQGVRLAFAHDVVRYHTPLDDLRHLDLGSVQHQGENAVALVRALAEEDLDEPARETAVFLDLLGLTVLSYRHPIVLAIAAALAAALAAAALLGGAERPIRALLAGLAAASLAPVLAALPLLLAWLALRQGALPRPFVAWPQPFTLAAWASGGFGVLLAAAAAGKRAGPRGLFAGAAVLHAVLGLVLAFLLPGTSHLAVLPALAAGIGGIAWARSPSAQVVPAAAALLPGLAAGLAIFPVAILLPPMLGAAASILSAALVSLALVFAAPLAAGLAGRARLGLPLSLLAAAFVACGVQAALPHATPERPERASIAFHEGPEGARWLVRPEHDALPGGFRAAAPFGATPEAAFPWAPRRLAFSAPAASLGLPAPRLDRGFEVVERGGVRRVRARLVSPRGAPVVFLLVPTGVEILSLSVQGRPVPAPVARAVEFWGGHRLVACVTTPPEGLEIEAAILSAAPVPVILVDQSYGLPAEGARLLQARPATAVASQEGDVTIVTARGAL